MKRIYIISKSNKNSILLFAPNGGVLHSFDMDILPNIQVIRGACINLTKQHQKKYFNLPKDEVELQDETNISHEVCAECGSTDVDIKCWINEKDGNISKPEEADKNDCYCNHCEKHVEVVQSDEDYILYESEKV